MEDYDEKFDDKIENEPDEDNEELLENDELSAEEEAFIRGYEEEGKEEQTQTED